MSDPKQEGILKPRLALGDELQSQEEVFKLVNFPRLFSLEALLDNLNEFSELLKEEFGRVLALYTNFELSCKSKENALLEGELKVSLGLILLGQS